MCCGVISDPENYIDGILGGFAKHDAFMARLIKVSQKFNAQKVRQDIHMCILRSDYMMDNITRSLKLVEYNTIACSFGCLSQKVKDLQNYICHKYCKELTINY